MGKRGRSGKNEGSVSKRRARNEYVASEEMDDEIDAFHKQRDVVPLDACDEESDDDNEQPVLDFEGTDNDESDEDDDTNDTGLAAKIVRQQKFLRDTMGGVEDDEMNEEEEAREDQVTWGRRKGSFYNADQAASSDEELPQEEEAEVLRLQTEKAKSLSMEDFGLEDSSEDESDTEPTLGEIAVRGDTKVSVTKRFGDDGAAAFEEVKKDLNALSKEEQMDVVYSSAPELVGLLSELNDATEELESQINPLLSKVRDGGNITKEGLRYLEVKQILLLAYCQAITFYLLLKSEGQSIRDHPVIGRLVEIKNLLDKVKELDGNLPPNLEAILDQNNAVRTVKLKEQGETAPSFDSFSKDKNLPVANGGSRELANALETVKLDSADDENKQGEQTTKLGIQSMKMLKVRASLEEKLRQKGQLSSAASKEERNKKQQKPLNGRLETRDDFDDDATGNLGANNESSLSQSHAVSSLLVAKQKKAKVISGDDDLPKRDDIGERRNKFERRVLQRAGVGSEDEADQDDGTFDADLGSSPEGTEADESEDEFYQQVKREKEAKLAAKAEKFSRATTYTEEPSLPETVDGKRHITYQIEKNRGLTRKRKKQDKNPRKKYRSKHEKASVRRKGQVREIRKPSGPYGGEATGINAGISRSIRFKG